MDKLDSLLEQLPRLTVLTGNHRSSNITPDYKDVQQKCEHKLQAQLFFQTSAQNGIFLACSSAQSGTARSQDRDCPDGGLQDKSDLFFYTLGKKKLLTLAVWGTEGVNVFPWSCTLNVFI